MLKEIVGMTKVANCIHATKIMWFHRLQAAYREPTKRFTWIQHARPNLAACNVPFSGITASTCDSTNGTMSPSITTGVTGSKRTTRTGSSESRSWQCFTASGAEML
jgi:hypothetical protein